MRGADPEPLLAEITVGEMTVVHTVGWIVGSIAALAAALKGVAVVWASISRAVHAIDAILDLASPEGWPNGSKTMKDSHLALYSKMESMQADVTEIRKMLRHEQ